MGRAISWTNRDRCPPIEDCTVKNTVQKGRRPSKQQQREIAKAIAGQEAASRGRRSAKKQPAQEPEQKRAAWPFAGSYSPKRDRGRG